MRVQRGLGEHDRHRVTGLAFGEGVGNLAAWVPKLGKWGGSHSGAEVVESRSHVGTAKLVRKRRMRIS